MLYDVKAISDSQISDIQEKTLAYIENYGVSVKHDKCREMLISHGASVDGDVVKLPRDVVIKAIAQVPRSFEIVARNRSKNVKIGVGMPNVAGPTTANVFVTEGNVKRHATYEDWTNLTKLAHTSDVCDFGFCNIVTPATENMNEALCKQFYDAVLLSDKAIISLTSNEFIAKAHLDMAKIAVNPDDGEYYTMGVLNSLSPLIWDETMIGSIYAYAQCKQPIVFTCCSMAGFTSHIRILETLLINNIEIIFGIVIAQLLAPGIPCVYGNVSGASDMKTMNLSVGSPDTMLITIAASQLAKLYNMPFRSGGCLTDAKALDSQAGFEAGTMMLMSYLSNVNFSLHALGMLEAFNSMSFEKWIFDEEIIRKTKYLTNKEISCFENDVLDIISEVGPGGNYLFEESTMTEFREAFFNPQVSDRLMYNAWKDRDLSVEAVCTKLWKERVEQYVLPQLEKNALEHLTKYYSELKY